MIVWSEFILFDTKILNHKCISKIQGCLIFAQSNSSINMINILISNVQSQTNDNIFLSKSFASFDNIFMLNIQSYKGEGSCFGATESKLILNYNI